MDWDDIGLPIAIGPEMFEAYSGHSYTLPEILTITKRDPLIFPLETARRIIERADGALTWSQATREWAILTRAIPGVAYPPL